MADNSLILNGEKAFLRPLTVTDANENYLQWLHDDEVMVGIATSGYTLESLREYVITKINTPGTFFFAICDKKTGIHIGNIKLDFHDKKANVSELGLLIGNKDYWGKGIGYEACHLAIDYGFNKIGLRKIYLAVYEPNTAARKLYEKLGFKIEATLRKHIAIKGKYYDKYLMGLFKNEFK